MFLKKKAILWDNDGVLVDTEGLFFRATREVLSKAGIDLSFGMFVEYCLLSGKNLFDLAKDKGFHDVEIKRMRSERNALYSKYLSLNNVKNPGIEDVLKKFYGNVKMGIVTTSRKAHFDIMHRNTGLLKYFDFVITREDYVFSKPIADPYLKGVEMSGYGAKECIAVEDSERGLSSAISANVDCVVIPNKMTRHLEFRGCLRIMESPLELEGFLLGRI